MSKDSGYPKLKVISKNYKCKKCNSKNPVFITPKLLGCEHCRHIWPVRKITERKQVIETGRY